jgi:hypothetical protein
MTKYCPDCGEPLIYEECDNWYRCECGQFFVDRITHLELVVFEERPSVTSLGPTWAINQAMKYFG